MKASEARKLSNENSQEELEGIYACIEDAAGKGGRAVRISLYPGPKEGTIEQIKEDGYQIEPPLHGAHYYKISW